MGLAETISAWMGRGFRLKQICCVVKQKLLTGYKCKDHKDGAPDQRPCPLGQVLLDHVYISTACNDLQTQDDVCPAAELSRDITQSELHLIKRHS